MQRSEAINELATALAIAQGQMETAKKDSINPFFNSVYADLASVWEACRKPLSNNGLAVVQTTTNSETNGRIIIETTLLHKSGQWLSGTLALKPKQDDPQSDGSAITYGRRYSLAAMVGVCPDEDDDDGNIASGKTVEAETSDKKEHWCVKHSTAFFKTARMRSYAHPIADTRDWCYETKKVEASSEAPPVGQGGLVPAPADVEKMQKAVDNADVSPATVQNAPVSPQEGQGTAQTVFIDMDWLAESLRRMKYDFASYVKGVLQFKVITKGKTNTEIVSQLTHEQQETMVKNLQERAKASGLTLD